MPNLHPPDHVVTPSPTMTVDSTAAKFPFAESGAAVRWLLTVRGPSDLVELMLKTDARANNWWHAEYMAVSEEYCGAIGQQVSASKVASHGAVRRRELPRNEASFAGIPVSLLDVGDLMAHALAAFTSGSRLLVTCINPDYARQALRSVALLDDINRFDLVLVDGNGVRLMAWVLGVRVPQRLDTDLVAPLLLRALAERRGKVYLFGCAPGVAIEAGRRMHAAFPDLTVVGTEHGFYDVESGHPGSFPPIDSIRIVRDIQASGADLLVVSLPTPMQQRWVIEHAEKLLCVPVILTAGSWLDHVAESATFPESWYPRWAQRMQLNWLFRLVRAPRSLWRRYSLEFLHFSFLVLKLRRETHYGRPVLKG